MKAGRLKSSLTGRDEAGANDAGDPAQSLPTATSGPAVKDSLTFPEAGVADLSPTDSLFHTSTSRITASRTVLQAAEGECAGVSCVHVATTVGLGCPRNPSPNARSMSVSHFLLAAFLNCSPSTHPSPGDRNPEVISKNAEVHKTLRQVLAPPTRLTMFLTSDLILSGTSI